MPRIRPYLKLAADILRANLLRPAAPYRLVLCVTYWCNYRCKTCNIWKMRPRDELSLAELRTFFAKNRGFRWVDLTGGEVWLRPDFVEICRAVVEECPDLLLLHFPTNGFQTERIVEGVREIAALGAPRTIVTVSMDGDEQHNDFIRGVQGGWRKQIETFRRLSEIRGIQVVLGMTVSQYNLGHYRQAFAAARRECPWLSHDDFHMNIVTTGHLLHNHDLELGQVSADRLIGEVREYRRLRGPIRGPVSFLERRYLRLAERYLRGGRTPLRCQALNSSCYIDSWGQVFPCTVYGKPLGSLREAEFDLRAIWDAAETRRTQREIWRFDCPQCWTPCEAHPSILGSLFRPSAP